jgi:hypothetical protein
MIVIVTTNSTIITKRTTYDPYRRFERRPSRYAHVYSTVVIFVILYHINDKGWWLSG